MPPMTLEELTDELTAQKETIQLLFQQLQEEREERQKRDAESAPVGTIAAFGGGTYTNLPHGWLPCNGASKSRNDYPKLFETIGESWGAGASPPETFNLPDLTGMFLRGLDAGSGRDPDSANRTASSAGGSTGDRVGSLQRDQMQSHKHADAGHIHSAATTGRVTIPSSFPEEVENGSGSSVNGNEGNQGSFSPPISASTTVENGTANLTDPVASTAGTPRHGKETRPINAYVVWAIKADPQ